MQVSLQFCCKMQVLRRRQSGGRSRKTPKSPSRHCRIFVETCVLDRKLVTLSDPGRHHVMRSGRRRALEAECSPPKGGALRPDHIT